MMILRKEMSTMDFKTKNTDLILNKAIAQVWQIKKYSYKNIARPDLGILYLLSGNITYIFDGCKLNLKPGDIIYLPKGSNYEVVFDFEGGVVEDYLINFDVVDGKDFLNMYQPTIIFNDNTKVILDCFKDVVHAYHDREKSFLTNSLFYLCLNSLQTAIQFKNSTEEQLLFEKAANKLTENYEISIDKISKELHISRSSFQKKFILYFGLSPIEYRTEKRLKKAKRLLETTDMPIKEISDTLGFYDTAYFYKVFKKIYSITPSGYKKKKKTDF